MKEQQKLDRQERVEWRKIRIAELQGEDKKRADEIRKAQTESETEDKKRADESHIKIQIKELELKAQQNQDSASLAVTPPPRNKDAKSPKLPSFIDEKDELDSYLLCFKCYAENASLEKTHGLLS